MSFAMEYKTQVFSETFGTVGLDIEALESLDEAIDALFDDLEKRGCPEELERLSPYFGVIWPSARALTDYLASLPLRTRGALRVLEVGCGLAIPTLYLLKTLPLCRFRAMDFHPEVSRFLTRNLKRNEISTEMLEYVEENWADIQADEARKFDLVIGSDVLYESKHPRELADALLARARRGGEVIITDPGRPYLQSFQDEMRARGWVCEPRVVTTVAIERGVRVPKDVFILHFKSA